MAFGDQPAGHHTLHSINHYQQALQKGREGDWSHIPVLDFSRAYNFYISRDRAVNRGKTAI